MAGGRRRRLRLGLATAAAALAAVGGGAVITHDPWGPADARDAGQRASVSPAHGPHADQRLLKVLGRPQTATDRGSAPRLALRLLGGRYRGVRPADVRVLSSSTAGGTVVLVPVGGLQVGSARPQRVAGGDALCLFVVDSPSSASQSCFSADDVRDGTAWKTMGDRISGVVPDGIAGLRVAVPGRRAFDVPVHANAFTILLRRVTPGATIAWKRADGSPAPFLNGGPTRALVVPFLTGEMSPNSQQHECGKDRGGIVPKKVRCGAPARAYARRQAKRGAETERKIAAEAAAAAAHD